MPLSSASSQYDRYVESAATEKALFFWVRHLLPEHGRLRHSVRPFALRCVLLNRVATSTAQIPTPVCRTISQWAKVSAAEDLFNNAVEVLNNFSQNDVLVDQLFHERFCETDQISSKPEEFPYGGHIRVQQCAGIDSNAYHGTCVTTFTYTYAKVRNERGEHGWTAIRIRGGCECSLVRHKKRETRSRLGPEW